MKRLTILVVAALVLAAPISANAVVREFMRCQLNEGKSMADVEAALDEWRALANKAGFQDYKVEILMPVHAEAIEPGLYYWMGTTPNYERLGQGYNWWITDPAAIQMNEKFNKVHTCKSRESTTLVLEK